MYTANAANELGFMMDEEFDYPVRGIVNEEAQEETEEWEY